MTLQSFERALKQPKPSSQAWGALFSLFSLLMLSGQVYAAPATVELFAGGGNTSATVPTQTSQTNTYQSNLNNPTDNVATTYTPNTTVTYAVSSRFSTSNYASATNQPDLMFGGTATTGGTTVTSASLYSQMGGIGAPQNLHFAATRQNAPTGCVNGSLCSSGTTGGISTTENYGTAFFAATRGLRVNNLSTNGRHRVGSITVTFNRPVTNPVLQIAGLGGQNGSGLAFTAEFDLISNTSLNNSVSMSRLAGSQELTVNSTQILNNAATIGATTGSGGASGSAQIEGRRITSLTFDVYLRAAQTGGSIVWEPTNATSGDRFFFAVSSIEADSDLSIVKTQRIGTSGAFVATQILPNQTDIIQYQIVMSNGTTNALVNAGFSDIVPSNITGLSIVGTTTTGTGTTCPRTLAGNTLSGTFSGPASATCTITLQGTASTAGSITNTATILENATDPNTSNNSSSVNAIIAPSADLSVTKTNGVSTIAPAGTTAYTVVVSNAGPSAANGATFSDPSVAGLTKTSITCVAAGGAVCPTAPINLATVESATGLAIPTLPSGGSVTFTVNANVTTSSGTVTNTATVTAPAGVNELNTVNNSASDTDNVAIVIDPNGVATDQCSAANALNVITATSATLFDNNTTITTPVPVNSTTSGQTYFGTGPDGRLQVVAQLSWSQGNPTSGRTSSTLSIEVNGTRYALLTTLPGGQANTSLNGTITAANGATVSINGGAFANSVTIVGGTSGTAGSAAVLRNVVINLPTTVNAVTSFQSVFVGGTSAAADDVSFNFQTVNQCRNRITLVKALGNNRLSNTDQFVMSVAGQNGPATTTTTGTAATVANGSVTLFRVRGSTVYNLSEVMAAGSASTLSNYSTIYTCTNSSTGTTTVLPAANTTGQSFALTPQAGDDITCTMTNRVAADLQVTKTNNVTAVDADGITSYTVVVTNAGPSPANNAVFQDPAATGLTKTSISCTAAGGAVCPTSPTAAQIEAGLAIPTLPSGGSVTFTVNANVTATSGSVANTATITAPAGVTEINTANNTATDTDTVTPRADLSITKTNSVTTVDAGLTTAYTVVVSNAGPSAANGALFRDAAAATGLSKTTITCTATGGASCPTAPISVTTVEGAGIAIPTLPSGGSVTFTVNANVTATSGSVANTATVTAPAGTTEIDPANNTATDTDTVNPRANLSISKTNNVTAVNAGSNTAYTVVVSNAGPSAANGALFRDAAAAGLNKTTITCTAANGASCPTAPISVATVEGATGIAIPTLPSGGSVTFTVNATVTAISGSVSNTATVTAPAGVTEIDPANNTATDTDTVTPAVDLAVVKSQRAGTTGAFQTAPLGVLVLDTVQYELVFTNNGPSVVTNATLSDNVPTQFNNVSVLSATPANGATACTASNLGNNVSGTLSGPAGATCTVLIQARAGLTTGTYTNTATTAVPNGTVETNNANNSSSVQTAIAPAADLAIVKTQRSGTTGAFVGTPITVSRPQVVQYRLQLTNNGPTLATGATYTDTIPTNITGLTIVGTPVTTGVGTVCAAPTLSGQTLSGTFTANESGTCTIVVQGTATTTGSITNTATVTGVGVTDTIAENNSSSVDMTIIDSADLSITKTNGVSVVDAGLTTAYTVVVSNAGPSAANGALFRDIAAAGLSKTTITCTATGGAVCPTAPISVATVEGATGLAIPTLPSGGSVTFTVNATVIAASGSVSNTATVTAPAGVTEIDPANNTATDTDNVTPRADLSISKTNGVSVVDAGLTTAYTVVVSNAGPSAANGALFRDVAAAGLSKTTITCSAAGGAVCPTAPISVATVEGATGIAIPTLPSGGSVTFTVNATVTATSGSVSNTATVTAPAGTTEIDPANNTATDTDNVTPRADLSVTKTNSVTALNAGSSTTYSVVVTNAGPSAADGATFRDAVAAGLTKTNITCSATNGAVCPTAANVAALITAIEAGVAIPTLPSTGILTFAITATVTATSGSVSNTATVTVPAGVTEIDPANNTATDTDTVNGLVSITGRVFTDNSGTTGIAANAYNGVQNTGELGLAGSTVQLNNCAGTVIATTQTDGVGDYNFGVLLNQLSTPNFCITQTNLAGYTSVSGTAGYTRGTDTISIANSGALSYTGHNFGDARLNLVLTSDGQQTTTPSGTVSYPHILRSESVLSVGTLNTISTESPTLGWTTVLYRDTNCNGAVDGGETVLTSAIGQLLPNQEICVVQRVNAPANATNGAQHVATLSASYTATVQDSGVFSGSSNARTDTTLVGTAGLDLRKQVRVVASCPSTGADVAAFTERNTAKNGEFLEYQIIYSNRSTRNLSQLTVRDVAPSNTTFQSATCQSTPSGSSCTAPVSAGVNGDLAWSLTNIAPAATGSVRFCVRVPPLAEPPIQ